MLDTTTPSAGASTRSAGPPLRSGLPGDPPSAGALVALVAASQLAALERTAPVHFPARRDAPERPDGGVQADFLLFLRVALVGSAEIAGSDGVFEGQRWTDPDRTYPKLDRSIQSIDRYRFTPSFGRLESRLIATESRQPTSSRSASDNDEPTVHASASGR